MSDYPGALDEFTNPSPTDPRTSPSHAAQHADINDAMEAVQGTLGTNPQGSEATVAARLSALEGSPGGAGAFTEIVSTANYDVVNAQPNSDNVSPEFQFSVTANKFYLVVFEGAASGSSATADAAFAFDVTTGTMKGRGQGESPAANLGANWPQLIADGAGNTGSAPVGTPADLDFPSYVRFIYAFRPSANATFRVRFGNSVATSGATSRLLKGSVMRWRQMD